MKLLILHFVALLIDKSDAHSIVTKKNTIMHVHKKFVWYVDLSTTLMDLYTIACKQTVTMLGVNDKAN